SARTRAAAWRCPAGAPSPTGTSEGVPSSQAPRERRRRGGLGIRVQGGCHAVLEGAAFGFAADAVDEIRERDLTTLTGGQPAGEGGDPVQGAGLGPETARKRRAHIAMK